MQNTMERMQTIMPKKKHDPNAFHKTITRAVPYLTNHRPSLPRFLYTCTTYIKFNKYCTCHQKYIREHKQSHKSVTNSLHSPRQTPNTSPATKSHPPTSAKISKSTNSGRLPQNGQLNISATTLTLGYFIVWLSKSSFIGSFPTKLP